MDKNIIFPNGIKVPALGQGTWYMGENPAKHETEIRALQMGIDLGMTVIDTAEMYGDGLSEQLVGEAIYGRRDDVFLISKVLPWNASYNGTINACEQSLRRLKTDRIDLYLLHWSGSYPIQKTVEAMLTLQESGKILQWGVSNMDVTEMEDFMNIPQGNTCATDEVLYNLTRRGIEYDLIPWCESHNIPIIAYSPIEQGRLLNNPTLKRIAVAHSATPAQVALAWVLRKPNLLAIPKASSESHVRENFGSLAINLTDSDLALLDKAFPAPQYKKPLEMI